MQPKNVVVLGSAYGGGAVARVLAQRLPKTHRAVIIDKHSHFNHVYLFPRYGVLGPGHAHKAFIPEPLYDTSPNVPLVLRAKAVALGDGYVELDRSVADADVSTAPGLEAVSDYGSSRRVSWDYLVYALGCDLPPVLAMDARTKQDGISYLDAQAETIARAKSVLIVGGGALGIQYATDIADLYNNPVHAHLRPPGVHPKQVTLVHSRTRFLPLYSPALHDAVARRMDALGVHTVLDDRVLEMPSAALRAQMEDNATGRTVHTAKGKTIDCDLILQCTGQRPNSSLLAQYLPQSIDASGHVRVLPTLQVEDAPRIFAVGDVAAAGIAKAGHTAWAMGTLVGANIVSLIQGGATPLDSFPRRPPEIKLTLGLNHMAAEMLESPDRDETAVSEHANGFIDGYWEYMWKNWGADTSDPTK